MDDAAADDSELVRRFQRGDTAAFAQFVQRHQDRVYRFAQALLYRPEDARDAAQEVFLRAMGGLKGFLFQAAPRTWLLRVTRNVCREHNRRLRRHANVDALAAWESPLLATEAKDTDDHDRLRRAVAALPERQREVVILRMFEDLSVVDTARAMGCREGTVKAHLNKAVGNLRGLLGQGNE